MAEGGYDPDDTGTFDPNEGDDESTPLFPHRDEGGIEMKHRTPPRFHSERHTTSTSRRHESSFMSETPGVKTYVDRLEQEKDEAVRKLKRRFKNSATRKFFTRIKDGRVEVKLKKVNSVWYPILDEVGKVLPNYKEGKFPKMLSYALGMSETEKATFFVKKNIEQNDKDEKKIRELRGQRDNASLEDVDWIDDRIEALQEGINDRNQDNERLEGGLSLRQRIKEIFKKHGFTAFAVATAIGTVIGVIVSNLKAGLTQVANGTANALKELGSKIGQILPGL